MKGYLARVDLDFAQFKDILDLGCGVGRFAFAFRQDLAPGQRLWGCDVFKECADWCRKNIDFAEIAHTSVEPPLPYGDGQFDLVYALSVFTHLRFEMQFKWAWEIHRVLRPGGILFATVHGGLFIPLILQNYLNGGRTLEFYSIGDEAQFAYTSHSGKSRDEGQVSVAAAQTKEFVKEQFSGFDFAGAFPGSDLAGEQDLYIVRRPNHGRSIARPLSEDGKIRPRSSWIGKVETATSSDPLSLRFTLNGHRRFHVYPRIVNPAIFALDCQIDLRAEGRLLYSKLAPLNLQRLFGDSQYFVIDIEVPEYDGEVIVDLLCRRRQNTAQAPAGIEKVEWNFPNFV